MPVNTLYKWFIGSSGSTKYVYELTTELPINTKLYLAANSSIYIYLFYRNDNNDTDLVYIGSKI